MTKEGEKLLVAIDRARGDIVLLDKAGVVQVLLQFGSVCLLIVTIALAPSSACCITIVQLLNH